MSTDTAPITTTSTTTPDAGSGPEPQWPVVTFPEVTWFEVHTADPAEATAFYGGLFGWAFGDLGDGSYHDIRQGDGQRIGGGIAATGGEWPSCVIPCVQVHDVAATCERATGLGGKVLAGPNATPTGIAFAYLADREGSAFGVWSPPA
jgi:uncharacterized protein